MNVWKSLPYSEEKIEKKQKKTNNQYIEVKKLQLLFVAATFHMAFHSHEKH